MRPSAPRQAGQGERMIEINVRFWTNDIADGRGRVIPTHAWSSGVVRIGRNPTHGITPKSPKPFHSLLDLGAVIERVLVDQGVTLHPSRRMRKYVAAKPG
jgi:hypothetical protein